MAGTTVGNHTLWSSTCCGRSCRWCHSWRRPDWHYCWCSKLVYTLHCNTWRNCFRWRSCSFSLVFLLAILQSRLTVLIQALLRLGISGSSLLAHCWYSWYRLVLRHRYHEPCGAVYWLACNGEQRGGRIKQKTIPMVDFVFLGLSHSFQVHSNILHLHGWRVAWLASWRNTFLWTVSPMMTLFHRWYPSSYRVSVILCKQVITKPLDCTFAFGFISCWRTWPEPPPLQSVAVFFAVLNYQLQRMFVWLLQHQAM